MIIHTPASSPDEQHDTALEYDRWLSRNTFSARWVRFWFSPGRTLWLNTQVRRLPAAASLTATDRILDVGCGYGGLLIHLHTVLGMPRHPAKPLLEGLDSSSLMTTRAAAEIRTRSLEAAIRIHEGFATALPYDDSSFDVVVSAYVIKHLSDTALRQALREVKRVLKPGGRFCVWEAVPSRFGFMNAWNMILLRLGVSFIRMRTPEDLKRLLEEEDFTIEPTPRAVDQVLRTGSSGQDDRLRQEQRRRRMGGVAL